jgi:thiol-disulfide isomerase/thioredoxin
MNTLCALVITCCLASAAACFGQETAGIGVALDKQGDRIVIKKVLPDGPAAASNQLKENDRVLAVGQGDEAPVQVGKLPLAEVVRMVRGAKGTTVRLTVAGADEKDGQARVISLVRGELKGLARWGDGKALPVGAAAPDVRWVRLSDNKPERLSDFKGKIVVLVFWATWCPPCRESMAELQTYAEKHPEWKDKVVLLTASVDEKKEDAAERLRVKGWDKTRNVWVEPEAIKAYHVNGIPMVYVITPEQKVAAAGHALEIPEAVQGVLAK